MSDLERIVVLAGGLSPEREVSLRSGDRVRGALAGASIHVIVADAGSALLSLLRDDPPSAVFPAIHGICGEDGAIREVTETSTLPLALEASGRPFGRTCVRLLEQAAARGA